MGRLPRGLNMAAVEYDLVELRQALIHLRNQLMEDTALLEDCDYDGAVILSHAIRWLKFKIEGKPWEPPDKEV